MYRDIDVECALALKNSCFIDVRSPGEYAAGTIPGAINVPLFDDTQRHFIGLTYKEEGFARARLEGLRIVSGKLPGLVERILDSCRGAQPVLFCWRGGMRSCALAGVMGLVGIDVFRLTGGYKAYRQFILAALRDYTLKADLIVFDGNTGAGKTELLHRLARRGHPVLDLEDLAGHRGSVFGGLGQSQPRGQKMFDALLYEALQDFQGLPYFLVEGESKRIGQVYLPDFLFIRLQNGKRIKVEASMETRIARILKDYKGMAEDMEDEIDAALTKLVRHMGRQRVEELKNRFSAGDREGFTRILLREYYDPLYQKSQLTAEKYHLTVNTDDMAGAVAAVEAFLVEHYPEKLLPGKSMR